MLGSALATGDFGIGTRKRGYGRPTGGATRGRPVATVEVGGLRCYRDGMRTAISLSGLCALMLLFSWTAMAQDLAVKVTESDFNTYYKLRYSEELFRTREMFAHGDGAKKKFDIDEFDKAIADSGWTREKYEGVSTALGDASQALGMMKDPEQIDAAKETLASLDKVTVETAKTHQKEIDDGEPLRQRAMKQIQADADAAVRGENLTTDKLEGKWLSDIEATVELNTQKFGGEELKKTMRESLLQTMPEATYVFGPGDKMESIVKRGDGTIQNSKGTYRIDGDTLFLKAEGRRREYDIKAGIKDGTLRLGMMGAYTVLKRE